MNIQEQHDLDVSEICQQLQNALTGSSQGTGVTLSNTLSSNTTRSSPYKQGKCHLNIQKLNRILDIDVKQQRAIVEPRVTMETLVEAALQHGLVPAVLPEFKGITVGGAIMGTALESSSHLYGQFNDNCLSYDVLLGNGSVVHASPSEHADLFYGLSGSYGSLGLILKVELALIPAKEYVRLEYSHYGSVDDAIHAMNQMNANGTPPDFLESLAFNQNDVIVIEGRFSNSDEVNQLQQISLKSSWSPWYYQHLVKVNSALDIGKTYSDYMTTKDYLFRLDRGAFWMGSYVLHGALLWKFIQQTFLGKTADDLSTQERELYHHLRCPNLLQRILLGWGMNTQTLYKLLHGNRETWFDKRFVIQDYYIPNKQVSTFTTQVFNEFGINPIWLCPMKSTPAPQILSPHYKPQTSDGLMYDVGVYGMPKGNMPLLEINRQLEKWTTHAGGRKMLYSSVYYSPIEFWDIYPKEQYQQLRKRYYAEGVWLSIDDKILRSY